MMTGALLLNGADGSPDSELWRFDRLDKINGHEVTVLGHPRLIDTPAGKALQFNGVDDAIYVNSHPLAGAQAFTWEVVFRPDGGAEEQRFFHLAEQDPKTKEDTGVRMLFELRVISGKWSLDSFVGTNDAATSKALLDREKLHSLKVWHHIAAVYDGKEYRNYVDGVLQGSAPAKFPPQGQGHSSVGVRINKLNYFNGAILEGRMTRHALQPSEFLKIDKLK